MDLIFELLFQLVGEFVVEVLGDWGFRGARAVWRSFVGRVTVNAAAGLAFGAFWAERLERRGRTDYPDLLWVSLALAVAGLLASVYRRTRDSEQIAYDPAWDPEPVSAGLLPWQWNARRWVVFVALNAGLAAGVAAFFDRM